MFYVGIVNGELKNSKTIKLVFYNFYKVWFFYELIKKSDKETIVIDYLLFAN
jgi:hypothetical protein